MLNPTASSDTRYDPRTFVEDRVFDAPGLLGWLTRRRKAAVVRFLRQTLAGSAAARLLDVGCGYGDMLGEIPAAVRVGLDANTSALAHAARRLPDAHFAVADAGHLPFGTGKFDAVICSEVLEHLDRPQGLASEIVRVTKTGGAYCITVPNETITTIGRFVLGKHPAKSPAHRQRFTPASISALFPSRPLAQVLTPFALMPFALSTNVVLLFTKR